MSGGARYRVLGISDEVSACGLCGRDDLRRTIILAPAEGGEPEFFGSDCAARALGWTEQAVTTASRTAAAAARAEREAIRSAAAARETDDWLAFLVARTGLAEPAEAIAVLGGFGPARAAYRETLS